MADSFIVVSHENTIILISSTATGRKQTKINTGGRQILPEKYLQAEIHATDYNQ
jgi:hypothetical protein